MKERSRLKSAVQEMRELDKQHQSALYTQDWCKANAVAAKQDELIISVIDLTDGNLDDFWDMYLEGESS